MSQSQPENTITLWFDWIEKETSTTSLELTRENSPTRYKQYSRQPEPNALQNALWDAPFRFSDDALEQVAATFKSHVVLNGESTNPPPKFPEENTKSQPESKNASESEGETTSSLQDTAPAGSDREALFDRSERDIGSDSDWDDCFWD